MSDVYFDRANGERYVNQSWVIEQIKEIASELRKDTPGLNGITVYKLKLLERLQK